MKNGETIISRSYIISQKEIKKKLNIKGDIQEVVLWSGINTTQEQLGETHDDDDWQIITHEIEK